jgi:hypothetical protein
MLIVYSHILYAQMPDWNTVKDGDGNQYFIDRNGKIWTSGKPEFYYRAVSLEGLDFYLNHGVELMRRHFQSDGLTILKSILAMPVANHRIYDAQVKASKEINNFLKKEGSRFKRLNANASVLLYRVKNSHTLIDDKMRFSIIFPFKIIVMRRKIRDRLDYRYQGILVGLLIDSRDFKKNEIDGYDALMAIDSEMFRSKLLSIEQLETNWKIKTGGIAFDRVLVDRYENSIIYEYKSKNSQSYAGFEGFYMKERYGYFIRIISSKELFGKHRKVMYELLKGFKI